MKRRTFIGLIAGLFVAPKKIIEEDKPLRTLHESWYLDATMQIKIDKINVSAADSDRWLALVDREWGRVYVTRDREREIICRPANSVTKSTSVDEFRRVFGGPDRSVSRPQIAARIRSALVGYRGDDQA